MRSIRRSTAVAVALARIGVGRLVIADFDVVEPSNLNRQQYFIDQIGQFKVEALACNLRRNTFHHGSRRSLAPRVEMAMPDGFARSKASCSAEA